MDGARRLTVLMRLAEPGRLDDTSLPAAARRSMARIAALKELPPEDARDAVAGIVASQESGTSPATPENSR